MGILTEIHKHYEKERKSVLKDVCQYTKSSFGVLIHKNVWLEKYSETMEINEKILVLVKEHLHKLSTTENYFCKTAQGNMYIFQNKQLLKLVLISEQVLELPNVQGYISQSIDTFTHIINSFSRQINLELDLQRDGFYDDSGSSSNSNSSPSQVGLLFKNYK